MKQDASAAAASGLVELTFGRDDLDLRAVRVGQEVWKTADPAVARELEATYNRDVVARPAPVTLTVTALAGQPLTVAMADAGGRRVEVHSPAPLEPSRKWPLTRELLAEQLGRLGGTPFALAGVELLGVAGPAETVELMAPKSVLNDLRRRAVEAMCCLRRDQARHAVVQDEIMWHPDPDAHRDRDPRLCGPEDGRGQRGIGCHGQSVVSLPVQVSPDEKTQIYRPVLHILIRTLAQLTAALGPGQDCVGETSLRDKMPATRHDAAPLADGLIYCDLPRADWPAAVETLRAAGAERRFALVTPRIVMPDEEDVLAAMAQLKPPAVLVRNLSSLATLRRLLPEATLVADFSLNVANALTAEALMEWGAGRVTPAFEADRRQISAMLRHIAPAAVEIILHRHVPMFHSRHCLYAAELTGAADRRSCGRPCRTHRLHLVDRLGERHPVLVDEFCRNTVFHARPNSLGGEMPKFVKLGIRHFRVERIDD